jgi:hypothetical protein
MLKTSSTDRATASRLGLASLRPDEYGGYTATPRARLFLGQEDSRFAAERVMRLVQCLLSLDRVQRMARLCRLLRKAGGWFSVENPEHSLVWIILSSAMLRGLLGCCSGLETSELWWDFHGRRPQGGLPVLAVVEERCKEWHHELEVFQDLIETLEQGRVFLIEIAAEYSEGPLA